LITDISEIFGYCPTFQAKKKETYNILEAGTA